MTMLKKLGLSLAVALFAVTSTLSTAQAAPAQLDKTVKVQPIKKGKQITAIKASTFRWCCWSRCWRWYWFSNSGSSHCCYRC